MKFPSNKEITIKKVHKLSIKKTEMIGIFILSYSIKKYDVKHSRMKNMRKKKWP